MKFAHMADIHLGGWRDPQLAGLNLKAFETAVDRCIEEKVDFILISGDLFDTAMPSFDILETVSRRLSDLKSVGIEVFVIAGSHDFSPSGKTMLKVLENAGILRNVSKGSDAGGKLKLRFSGSSGVKITGIYGKKGSLDSEFYKNLDRSISNEPGKKVFLFHCGIEEYRPEFLKDVAALPLSLMPKGFDYYAGGHIHDRSEHDFDGAKLIFPGPIFPCDFTELERYGCGGFYLVEDWVPRFVPIRLADICSIKINAEGKTAADVEKELYSKVESIKEDGQIVLIRVSGTLGSGRPSDIDFKDVVEQAYERGALVVRRNINQLSTREYREVRVAADTVDELEAKIISEGPHIKGIQSPDHLVRELMASLNSEKADGETVAVFEQRITKEADELLKKRIESYDGGPEDKAFEPGDEAVGADDSADPAQGTATGDEKKEKSSDEGASDAAPAKQATLTDIAEF